MQLAFRIECPHCHWGYEWKNENVNMGFLKANCKHCGKSFVFKLTITGVKVEFEPELPKDIPCKTLESEPTVDKNNIVNNSFDVLTYELEEITDTVRWVGSEDKYIRVREIIKQLRKLK